MAAPPMPQPQRRVLMASPGGRRGRGGMASLVVYLAQALPRRLPGVEIAIVDTYGPGAFWAMPFHFAAAAARIAAACALRRADLVHLHMAHYGSVTRKLTLAAITHALGVRTVVHLHGSDFDANYNGLPPWQRRLVVATLKRAARVVVIGTFWRDFAARALGLDPGHVTLIHNGAPRTPWRDRTAAGPARLLMLGELGPRKGTPELIAALAAPELARRAWTATLAGNGPVGKYRAEVTALGLSGRVALPGWQDAERARALLDAADIFVLPSRQEGLPIAILEAMAVGAAVISTPVGAIPDAVVEGETGLLVPPGDAAALARAIARLLDEPALRARLAENARRRFEAMFTIERTADAVAQLYRELGVG
ncbi:MAG: glycosyltransferase family 4 protein [Rhodospirillales bacterium]